MISKKKSRPTQVLAVTGGKGGVGKTSTSINIAISLAKQGKQVVLFDADLGLSNVDVCLGLATEQHIEHVLRGLCKLEDILIEGPNGIRIIPASSGIQHLTNLSVSEVAGLIQAFSELPFEIDTLIVDTAAGISNQVVNFIKACQEILIVVCNEPSSITDAYALIKILHQQHQVRHFTILANMVREQDEGQQLFQQLKQATDRFLEINLQYLGAIPFDEHFRDAAKRQKAITDVYPQSSASQSFYSIAEKIARWPVTQQAKGHISFFLEQLIESTHEVPA